MCMLGYGTAWVMVRNEVGDTPVTGLLTGGIACCTTQWRCFFVSAHLGQVYHVLLLVMCQPSKVAAAKSASCCCKQRKACP